MLALIGLLVFIVLICIWICARSAKVGLIYYFGRKSCPSCRAFDPEWEKLKALASGDWDCRFIDTESPNNKKLADNFGFKTVPSIWIILPDGRRFQFQGEDKRTAENIYAYAKNMLE